MANTLRPLGQVAYWPIAQSGSGAPGDRRAWRRCAARSISRRPNDNSEISLIIKSNQSLDKRYYSTLYKPGQQQSFENFVSRIVATNKNGCEVTVVQKRLVNGKKRGLSRNYGLKMPTPKLSAKQKRRKELERAKAAASEIYAELDAWLSERAIKLQKAKLGKRLDYYAVLDDIYGQVIDWDGDDLLDEYGSATANLQGEHRRKNLSPINIVVGAICKRADLESPQLRSRWSAILSAAFDDGVHPTDFLAFTRGYQQSQRA